MRCAVIVFPGSNCDRDMQAALTRLTGRAPLMAWHGDTELPEGLDLVALPGGFSYGDYLRAGAIAARSPIMGAVAAHAARGAALLGVCNGFQILTEAGLLPGALARNVGLKFICRDVALHVDNRDSMFTRRFGAQTVMGVAHADGRYVADEETLNRLEGDGRVAFRYADNPNGSARDIAGILNARGNVLGLMPHPERQADPSLGRTGGLPLFQSLVDCASVLA